jgi:predicted PurR-regulated permease PerM
MLPFLGIILWSVILAIAMFPTHKKLSEFMGGKPKLASVIVIFSIMVFFIVPTLFLVGSLVEEVKVLELKYEQGTLVPPPSEKVKEWPVVGKEVYDYWLQASADIKQFFLKHEAKLIEYGSKVAKGILGTISGIVHFILSFIIAGVLLAIGGTRKHMREFFRKVGGQKGDEFADMINKTVGSVVRGILGESMVMAILNGIVFLLAGVPFAAFWALLAFIFAVLQIPVMIISLGVMIYLFTVKTVVVAIIWSVTLVLVGLSDNVLTPLMLGKRAPVPMPVIFIGVLGGFMVFGFIGLFTGAIIISLGYSLYLTWFNADNENIKSEEITNNE